MSTKSRPYQAFEKNFSDAISLIRYARAFENRRNRRMRKELRSRVGDALRLPVNQREDLDCLENTDLFVVFKPGGRFCREQFIDPQPLLRQSLVAACAALETYVADKAMEFVGPILKSDDIPPRMKEINLTVGQWLEIERRYTRRKWGIRPIIGEYLRQTSSTASNKIGIVLSNIGVNNWSKKVDKVRGLEPGTTVRQLDEITDRRNLIAHTADRKGRGRASAKLEEVGQQLKTINEVVDAIEEMLGEHNE